MIHKKPLVISGFFIEFFWDGYPSKDKVRVAVIAFYTKSSQKIKVLLWHGGLEDTKITN